MSRIAIVTDSTSDIPKEMIEKYQITSVPLSVIFEEETFLDDGKQITTEEFYKKLRSAEKLPTTTQPTPKDFIDVYNDLLKDHERVLSIHISKAFKHKGKSSVCRAGSKWKFGRCFKFKKSANLASFLSASGVLPIHTRDHSEWEIAKYLSSLKSILGPRYPTRPMIGLGIGAISSATEVSFSIASIKVLGTASGATWMLSWYRLLRTS